MRKADPADQSGFTLVEVLVALVVSAFLLAIIFDGATTGKRRAKRAADHRTAILVADYVLTTSAAAVYQPGRRSGVAHGLKWTVTEQPTVVDPRGSAGLIALDATISDRGDHPLFVARVLRIKRFPAT